MHSLTSNSVPMSARQIPACEAIPLNFHACSPSVCFSISTSQAIIWWGFCSSEDAVWFVVFLCWVQTFLWQSHSSYSFFQGAQKTLAFFISSASAVPHMSSFVLLEREAAVGVMSDKDDKESHKGAYSRWRQIDFFSVLLQKPIQYSLFYGLDWIDVQLKQVTVRL